MASALGPARWRSAWPPMSVRRRRSPRSRISQGRADRAILRGDRTTRTAGGAVTDFETLLYTESDGVAWVTLNRPQALNSFDNTMRAELRGLWRALRTNDDVRCVVLTGAGERAFCVGIDRTAEDTYVIFERDTFYGTSNNYMYDDPGDDIGPKA